jgi:hypothetical protein
LKKLKESLYNNDIILEMKDSVLKNNVMDYRKKIESVFKNLYKKNEFCIKAYINLLSLK